MKDAPEVNFAVLAETEELLVVDKPAGVLIHPSKPGGPRTLWDELRALLAYELATGGQVSIINRLDRETSGVVLIAKHRAAARACATAMRDGRVAKEYEAIVHGWPAEDRFVVDAPIRRLGEVAPSKIWLKRAVHAGGAAAVTEFAVAGRFLGPGGGAMARVRARPLSGRTHQIRVHLAHAGHPVVGDKIYGPDEDWYLRFIAQGWTDEMARALLLPRHALHSAALSLAFDGRQFEWRSPLPGDMRGLIGQPERVNGDL